MFTDLYHLDQFGRIIIKVYHITGFFRGLGTTVHGHTNIGLGQCRGIIGTIAHHCYQAACGLFFFDVVHFIFRFGLRDKVIYSGFFCNEFCRQRIVSGNHYGFNPHFTQTFKTLLYTGFDDILQFDHTHHDIIFGHY
ncbi:hypothetical protein D9M68_743600 [compost metagenome]